MGTLFSFSYVAFSHVTGLPHTGVATALMENEHFYTNNLTGDIFNMKLLATKVMIMNEN